MKVVVVGGGSAGWLTAAYLAARHQHASPKVSVTLIESAGVPTIGVGEGTWPSMRSTLNAIGISETEFIRSCDVSLKQGTQFHGWCTGHQHDVYHHPFTAPEHGQSVDLAKFWQPHRQQVKYADAFSPQPHVSLQGKAPKSPSTPEYAFALNYGYHLDAGKFIELLKSHSVDTLAVSHIVADVIDVETADNGDITALTTRNDGVNGRVEGDLFIDCTGFHARLIGDHYKVDKVSLGDALPNDRAIALQVPYQEPSDAIASCTLSTAHKAGWMWDIGLYSRRGTGIVYASDFMSEDEATHTLVDYAKQRNPALHNNDIAPRRIPIDAHYRRTFWQNNCVAVGLSAGFIEPLEASALVLVELSAKYISDRLPRDRQHMTVVAKQFNQTFTYRWQQIADFLALHYVLSERQEEYWQAVRQPERWPNSLRDMLTNWQFVSPSHYDMPMAEEMFPAASFQYVYYGMGKETAFLQQNNDESVAQQVGRWVEENARKTQQLLQALPGNRQLLTHIREKGLPSI